MRARPIAASVIAVAVSIVGSASAAPDDAAGRARSTLVAQNDTPEVLPPAQGSDPNAAPAEPKKPAAPMAGYAYGDKAAPSAGGGTHHARYRKTGPVVNMPGFEQTGDGGSRLFVQLSQNVPVEERKAQGSITYVLKGASPRVYNNTNALVTVHFNTPVSKARLVPKGKDLLFVIDLRAAATPTWKVNEGPEKTSVLTIDFPKGDFLPAAGAAASDDAASTDAESGDSEGGEGAPPKPAKPKAAKPKSPPAPAKGRAPAGGAAPKP